MASIMTNASALTALQSLNSTNKNLEITQSRISTGYRVADASDNAAYWSIATTMRSDYKAMSTVQDSLGLGASKVDTAYTGMNKAIETVNEIKVKLVAANGASDADKAKINIEISALQSQLKSYASAATFSGANWLATDTTTGTSAAGTFDDVKIVASFNRNAAGSVSLGTIDVKVQDIKLYDAGQTSEANAGILDATRNAAGARTAASTATLGTYNAANTFTVASLALTNGTLFANDQQVTQMLGVVEGALKDMTTAATNLGAAKSRIDLQKTFTTSLMDSVERGVGQLVDADMNKESTRLQALQVQQQLGIQALSIANGNSQSILSLFR
ncbi:flagellin N-terminal helical domain-containing protein [Mesorhizobium sp. 10J20-29]